MLKVLDDLERAVIRLEEKARGNTPGISDPGHGGKSVQKTLHGRVELESEQAREEAAELIRRAIKRLRSL